jgi:hypothetical protein
MSHPVLKLFRLLSVGALQLHFQGKFGADGRNGKLYMRDGESVKRSRIDTERKHLIFEPGKKEKFISQHILHQH